MRYSNQPSRLVYKAISPLMMAIGFILLSTTLILEETYSFPFNNSYHKFSIKTRELVKRSMRIFANHFDSKCGTTTIERDTSELNCNVNRSSTIFSFPRESSAPFVQYSTYTKLKPPSASSSSGKRTSTFNDSPSNSKFSSSESDDILPSGENAHPVMKKREVERGAIPKAVTLLEPGEINSYVILLCKGRPPNIGWTKCAGVLINEELIITKVSCLTDNLYCYAQPFNDGTSNGEKIVVKGYCKLPRYYKWPDGRTTHDIGIALLEKKIKLSDFIEPACIDTKRMIAPNAICLTIQDFDGRLNFESGDKISWSPSAAKLLSKQVPCPPPYDVNQQTGFCWKPDATDNNCARDFGVGLYCMDKCGTSKKYYAVGAFSTLLGKDCSEGHAADGSISFFMDFGRIGKDLVDMMDYCYEPGSDPPGGEQNTTPIRATTRKP